MNITVSNHNIQGAMKWCQRRFLGHIWTVNTNWPAQGFTLRVPDNELGTMCALKWSS
jgi:hypothetical protein